MPTRTLLRLTLLAGLAAPLCAFALGVGPLAVRSALNQNFEAEIPLIVNNPSELTGLTVRIPRQQDFDQAGIERLEFLSKLRFSVQTPPGGPNLIRISSIEPIREPNFNLLLELVWPRGRLIREFTVQVDPELYANRRPPPPPPVVMPPPVAVPPVAAAPPAAPALPPAPSVSFEGASLYGPIRPGETLMAVANRVRPSTAVSLPQMMSILLAGNSEAFANGNPNALRAGSMLKVPTAQALGVQGAPTPPSTVPGMAAAPPATGPVATQPPVEPAVTEPPAVSPAVVPPPSTVGPVEPTTPPVASAPSILSPAEQPREIVPQASIPKTEALPVPAGTTAGTATPPAETALAQPQPAPAAKPPAKPEVAESSWTANPVVWIAIALILLAIAAVVLLPLLRRPARPKVAARTVGAAAEPSREPAAAPEAAVGSVDATTTQAQVREGLTRPLLAAAGSSVPAAAAAKAGAAAVAAMAGPKPATTPQPKSVTELLKDIDFGLEGPPPVFGGKGVPPAPVPSIDRRAPLPDTEPATASETRKPTGPLAEPPTEPAPKEAPLSQADLPSGLRLDGFDFDFGELGLQQPASQPAELPPLEMKPAAPGPRFAGLPSGIDRPEPATEPASISAISAILSAQAASEAPAAPTPPSAATEQKFTFTDVTQGFGKQDAARGDLLKLDEELQSFGGQSLDLGKMEAESLGNGGDDTASDYVETKLDLATAYLDMGDQVGARGLLEEVLQEGNTSQKQRAEELLKKVG
jgi:pilus assembly protein FimV